MNTLLLLYLPVLFLGGVFSSAGGGGLGVITVILGSFFFDLRTNIAFTSILMTTVQVAKIINFHGHIQWDTVLWYVLLGLPASFLGGWLLYIVPTVIPRITLAAFCFIFVLLRFTKRLPPIRPTQRTLVLFGAVNGLVGGLIGNASLVRMPALVAMGMNKELFVGTSAMIALLMNLGKVAAYLSNFVWTQDYLVLYAASIPVVFLSVWIGKKLLRFISVRLFEDLQLAIITLGALRLLLFPA